LKKRPDKVRSANRRFQIQLPAELKLALAGLWWDAEGDWARAHKSAQQDDSAKGSWVHAYLHRKESE